MNTRKILNNAKNITIDLVSAAAGGYTAAYVYNHQLTGDSDSDMIVAGVGAVGVYSGTKAALHKTINYIGVTTTKAKQMFKAEEKAKAAATEQPKAEEKAETK